MSRARIVLLVVAVAVLLGAASGRRSFQRFEDPRPMCGTCHHTLTRLDDEEVGEPPHRTELGVECHRCHVVPLKEYVTALGAVVGADTSGLASGLHDPTVGGQTCIGCHVGRGRGSLDCDRCHQDGNLQPDLSSGCSACHSQRPMHPHDDQPCRQCHVESTIGHASRTATLMHDKLFGDAR